MVHHSSFQGAWGETLVDELWIDRQLDAKWTSLGCIQLGNYASEHHARAKKMWQGVDVLWSKSTGTRLKMLSQNCEPIHSLFNWSLQAYICVSGIQLLIEQLGVWGTDVTDAEEALQATWQADGHLKVCHLLHATQHQHALFHILGKAVKQNIK